MSRSAVSAGGRDHLVLATLGTLLGAADTYVIVLALPDIMTSVGLDVTQLQRAAPVISLFLLGYVAVLPLAGRVSDRHGRVPVLVACLVVFAVGSMLTAVAPDLPTVVIGRFLQGVGGGGLAPVTLALVADRYPADRRGLPLGVVGAVQEAGAVFGPLFGAAVIALAGWRTIFWINLGLAAFLALALARRRRFRDGTGAFLGILSVALVGLTLAAPTGLTADVTLGQAYVPVWGEVRLFAPIGLASAGVVAVFVVREIAARAPIVPLRRLRTFAREVDLLGAVILGAALAGVVFTFSTSDPAVQTVSAHAPWLLGGSAVAALSFGIRQRRRRDPLVPLVAVRSRGAWGSLVVSALTGAALIAVLVDVPLYARVVIDDSTQLEAAFVLLRFLVAVPVGAVGGGWLVRRAPPGVVAAAGLLVAAAALGLMASWTVADVHTVGGGATLALAGFAFGLVIAPVNAAVLGATPDSVHGVASALVVGARMIGMLVGVSALTAIGLRRYQVSLRSLPSPTVLCPSNPSACDPYTQGLRGAALDQVHAVFTGAAVCAVAAAVLSILVLPRNGRNPSP